MIEIDGSIGEGGGQVLRTALTLSVITSQAVKISNIRAGRTKPGLRPQHLIAVEASREICGAKVVGDVIGSPEITFQPNKISPGTYQFDIGTAGSTSLVMQTIFYPLALSGRQSSINISGGTHVPWSPCYHYLAWHWLKYIIDIGFSAELNIERAGYFPKGGGFIHAEITPSGELSPIDLCSRGKLLQVRGISGVSNLPGKIAERQRNRVIRRIGSKYPLNDIRIVDIPSKDKGTFLLLIAVFETSQACFFGLGKPGKPSEKVADEAVDQLERFMLTNGAIDPYLADQLLLPLSLAKGTSRLNTSMITQHLLTNALIVQKFLTTEIAVGGKIGTPGKIIIESE